MTSPTPISRAPPRGTKKPPAAARRRNAPIALWSPSVWCSMAAGSCDGRRCFAGNVAESTTLADMLKGLTAPKSALVIMDAGIATAANIAWLKEQEHRYLVVSRERGRQFDPAHAVDTLTASNETIQLQRVLNADG